MSDEIVENLKKPSAWLRVLFMAGFAVALYVVGVVLLVLMLAQIVFSLVTGSDNANLRKLGASLSEYVAQILAFLTYNSEEKPFPFTPFPLSDELEGGQQSDLHGYADAAPKNSSQTTGSPAEPDPFAAAAEAAADTTVSAQYRAEDSVTAPPPAPASEVAAGKSPAKKAAVKKPAVKKPAVKKSPAKKSAAEKSSAAKPAAKSTAGKSATKKSTSKGAVTGNKDAGSKSND